MAIVDSRRDDELSTNAAVQFYWHIVHEIKAAPKQQAVQRRRRRLLYLTVADPVANSFVEF